MDLCKLKQMSITSAIIGFVIVLLLITTYPIMMEVTVLDISVYIYFSILLIILVLIITPLYLYWDRLKTTRESN